MRGSSWQDKRTGYLGRHKQWKEEGFDTIQSVIACRYFGQRISSIAWGRHHYLLKNYKTKLYRNKKRITALTILLFWFISTTHTVRQILFHFWFTDNHLRINRIESFDADDMSFLFVFSGGVIKCWKGCLNIHVTQAISIQWMTTANSFIIIFSGSVCLFFFILSLWVSSPSLTLIFSLFKRRSEPQTALQLYSRKILQEYVMIERILTSTGTGTEKWIQPFLEGEV